MVVAMTRTYPESWSSMSSILVADDDFFYRDLIGKVLMGRGFEVTLVSKGYLAQAALRTMRFDLAVLDVHLEGRDGAEILEGASQWIPEGVGPLPPFVLISGDSSGEAERKARLAGSSAFLSKPFVPDELVNVVDVLMSGCRRTRIAPISR